jgi:hypothetical protein
LGGSYVQSDLAGTWHIFGLSSGGINEGSIYGTININSGGSVTGSYTHSNGTIVSITSGTLTMQAIGGDFVGTLTTTAGSSDIEFILDSSKYISSFYTLTNFGGAVWEYDFFMAIKAGGAFNTTDLGGTWYIVLGASGGANEGVSYGTIVLNSVGQVTGGYYRSGNSNISFVDGSLTIDANGVLDGSVTAADGMILDVTSGKMSQSKTSISAIGQTNTGNLDMIIAYKGT